MPPIPVWKLNSEKYLSENLINFFQNHIDVIHQSITEDEFLSQVMLNISAQNPHRIHKSLLKIFIAIVRNKCERERTRNFTHFVEKTPTHFNRVDNIFADFHEAKIIHMLRDPRDNYLALKRRMCDKNALQYQNSHHHPIIFLNSEILASLDTAYQNISRYGEDRYRVLFYEDLIHNGEHMMRKINSWLKLTWHDCLLIPSWNNELWKNGVML